MLFGAGFVYAAFLYLTLPDVRPLRTANPDTTAFMELRAREARAKGAAPKKVQRWVPYSRISGNLKRAVLVAEDSGFWQHEGIEFEQLKESIEANIERLEFARGGSTITQQLAKNLYLSPSKNPIRKLREILIARRLEAELTKQRILELYLNVIEWGDDIYGAEAAARTYFGKSAAELSPQESALLAGAIINPHIHSPAHPNRAAAAAAADDHAAHGRGHAASGRGRESGRKACRDPRRAGARCSGSGPCRRHASLGPARGAGAARAAAPSLRTSPLRAK